MGLGDLFGKLFGGGGDKASSHAADPVDYNGFRICPEPIKEGSQYRTAGWIEKNIGDELRRSRFIRADNNTDLQASIDHSVQKGRQIIDEQGDRLFDRETV